MDRDKFLEPETRYGYYISEEQKKLWSLEMETYEKLAEVCNKHGLKFFVSCGTLLGAVRHKGFSPRDLDMDVCMPRTDYDRLVSIAANEFHDPFEPMSVKVRQKRRIPANRNLTGKIESLRGNGIRFIQQELF